MSVGNTWPNSGDSIPNSSFTQALDRYTVPPNYGDRFGEHHSCPQYDLNVIENRLVIINDCDAHSHGWASLSIKAV